MTIPCKDCITLPMCIGKYKTEPNSYSAVYDLTLKCSLLNEYLINLKTSRSNLVTFDPAIQFYSKENI